jgi:hypothetical protein
MPVVFDGEHHLIFPPLQTQGDAPFARRELHGIRQQVPDNLLQPILVADDRIDLLDLRSIVSAFACAASATESSAASITSRICTRRASAAACRR